MSDRHKSFAVILLFLGGCAGSAPGAGALGGPRGAAGAVQAEAAGARPALPTDATAEPVRNVILFIGDGVGTAYWTAAKLAAGTLAVQQMRVMGLTDTRSADSDVTDSAAAATTFATGQRTYNGAIGVGMRCRDIMRTDPGRARAAPRECDPLEGVFDLAWKRGIATGLVATSSLTHATPAAFGAKVPDRSMQAEIAAQLATNPIDVLLGGGRGFFAGSLRPDTADLLTPLCVTAVCLGSAHELARYQPDDRRLVGLFGEEHMERARPRQPTLPTMTHVALDRLRRNPLGFFLMVEGSQPDWRGHDHEPLEEVAAEMIDFDQAIAVGLEFARENPGTLVLVVSDHETGGLALILRQGRVAAGYVTTGHTGEMTPHFAFGAGAERFAGIMENHEIGRLLLEIVRRE